MSRLGHLATLVRLRLAPALLTSVGLTLVTAGLLTYLTPAAAQGPSGGSPPLTVPSDPGLLTFPPLPSGGPSPTPAHRVATRVVIPALGIDLPVIRQPGGPDAFPPCNVAMYLPQLSQPGQPGATYIYAHARAGMFLPLLEASWVNNGARLIGMLVQVYTSDNQVFLYEITQVRRHQYSLDAAFAVTDEELWLQTSEGPRLPNGQIGPKLQVIARPLSSGPVDPAAAHPSPSPIFCQ
jgi:hypothetical protein